MADAFWIVFLVIVSIGMILLARRIEPHWASKDGRNFTCRIQELSADGRTAGGRWIDARARIVDNRVVLDKLGLLRQRPTKAGTPQRVVRREEGVSTRFAVFLLEGPGSLAVLRVPAHSSIVAQLEDIATG